MDTTQRINDLILIATEFADVVAAVNETLKNNNAKQVEALFQRKDSLSRAYESHVKGLANISREDMAKIDEELRGRLTAAGKKLEKVIEENTQLLKIALDIHHKVVDAIAEAVRDATPSAGTYGANGSTGYSGHAAPKSASFTLNETL